LIGGMKLSCGSLETSSISYCEDIWICIIVINLESFNGDICIFITLNQI
jgi:hypothetical protein